MLITNYLLFILSKNTYIACNVTQIHGGFSCRLLLVL